jgi:hypothetical protein
VDGAAVAIVGLVALSLVALVAMARRRSWNADGEDDARRDAADEGRTPESRP